MLPLSKPMFQAKQLQHGERTASTTSSGKQSTIYSITSSIASSIRSGTTKFSDWVLDWTPVALVFTYFVVSTAVFCLCNQTAIRVFYFFYMATNFYIAAC